MYCTSAYANRNSCPTTLNLFADNFSPMEKLIQNWGRSARLQNHQTTWVVLQSKHAFPSHLVCIFPPQRNACLVIYYLIYRVQKEIFIFQLKWNNINEIILCKAAELQLKTKFDLHN